MVGQMPDMAFCHIHPLEDTGWAGDPPPDSWGIQAVGAGTAGDSAAADVRIAILDTCIDRDHLAFSQGDLSLIYEDFTGTGTGLADDVGHGTHCAGTIFGRDVQVAPGQGVRIGIARGVRTTLNAKVLTRGGGSTESVMRGMLWAMQERDHFISMSLGIEFAREFGYWRARVSTEVHAFSKGLAGYRQNLLVFDRLAQFAQLLNGPALPLIIAAACNSSKRPIL
ncbi:S8 family serine peptidase [Sedimentitalea sp.]|uniref:S8 family serine peptidase n=1 Tax=Sedimentitalea sp. TaxID=2048915 RepID=UPI00329A7C74